MSKINKFDEEIFIERTYGLLQNLLIIDGQGGSGKTMFTQLCASFKNVELFNYCTEIENICGLDYLNKIDKDASKSLIKIQLDQMLYETMMGRKTNFRFSDLSSAFNDTKLLEYLRRIFSKGDEIIPEIVKIKKQYKNRHLANMADSLAHCFVSNNIFLG